MENERNKQLELLYSWSIRLNKSQIGHYLSYEKFHKIDRGLGVSVLLFSGITTGLLLFDNKSHLHFNIVIIVTSLITSIVSSLQVFLQYGKLSEAHKRVATKYGNLKRNIESFLSKPVMTDINTFISNTKREWEMIADESPVTLRSIREKTKTVILTDVKDDKEISDTGKD